MFVKTRVLKNLYEKYLAVEIVVPNIEVNIRREIGKLNPIINEIPQTNILKDKNMTNINDRSNDAGVNKILTFPRQMLSSTEAKNIPHIEKKHVSAVACIR